MPSLSHPGTCPSVPLSTPQLPVAMKVLCCQVQQHLQVFLKRQEARLTGHFSRYSRLANTSNSLVHMQLLMSYADSNLPH